MQKIKSHLLTIEGDSISYSDDQFSISTKVHPQGDFGYEISWQRGANGKPPKGGHGASHLTFETARQAFRGGLDDLTKNGVDVNVLYVPDSDEIGTEEKALPHAAPTASEKREPVAEVDPELPLIVHSAMYSRDHTGVIRIEGAEITVCVDEIKAFEGETYKEIQERALAEIAKVTNLPQATKNQLVYEDLHSVVAKKMDGTLVGAPAEVSDSTDVEDKDAQAAGKLPIPIEAADRDADYKRLRAEGWITIAELAVKLGVSDAVVRNSVSKKEYKSEQVYNSKAIGRKNIYLVNPNPNAEAL